MNDLGVEVFMAFVASLLRSAPLSFLASSKANVSLALVFPWLSMIDCSAFKAFTIVCMDKEMDPSSPLSVITLAHFVSNSACTGPLLPLAGSHMPCGRVLLLKLHLIHFPSSSSQLAFVGCSHGPNSFLLFFHLTSISRKRIKPSPPPRFLPSNLPLVAMWMFKH